MPLPAGVTLVPFHGVIVGPNGANAVGTVTFDLPYALRDSANNVIVGPAVLRARLTDGEFTLSLPATDDPDISPTGWLYEVWITTDVWTDHFFMAVPHATSGTLELADVAPVSTPPDVTLYALASHSHTLDSLSDVNVATATNGQVLGRVGGVWQGVTGGGGGGVTDHGDLSGLGDDDHPQYLTAARGDGRYYTQAQLDTALGGKENTGVAATLLAAHTAAADPHPGYATDTDVINGLAIKQPLDADLSAFAALAPADDSVLQRKAGAWTARTPAQLKADLALGYGDLTGSVPTSALPPLAINDTFVVADQAAMLALTAQRGDIAVRSDNGRTYVLATDTPGNVGDWKEILAAGQVQSVAGKTGVVTLTKSDVGLPSVNDTSDVDKPLSTAAITALAGKVDKSLVDAAGDLLVGSAADTLTRLAKGSDGQILTVVSGALAYADPVPSGLEADPGDDILALYGYHSATSHISAFDSEFGQNNEIWIGRVCVRAGRPIAKIGTIVKTAGTLGAGGTNGFAIASDDGAVLHYSVIDDDLWTSAGEVSVALGGSAIPAQPTDTFYRLQLSVQGYSSAPMMLLAGGDHAVLSDFQGRARFANASAGYQSGGGYNPLTFGGSTGGFYPLIMVG